MLFKRLKIAQKPVLSRKLAAWMWMCVFGMAVFTAS